MAIAAQSCSLLELLDIGKAFPTEGDRATYKKEQHDYQQMLSIAVGHDDASWQRAGEFVGKLRRGAAGSVVAHCFFSSEVLIQRLRLSVQLSLRLLEEQQQILRPTYPIARADARRGPIRAGSQDDTTSESRIKWTTGGTFWRTFPP